MDGPYNGAPKGLKNKPNPNRSNSANNPALRQLQQQQAPTFKSRNNSLPSTGYSPLQSNMQMQIQRGYSSVIVVPERKQSVPAHLQVAHSPTSAPNENDLRGGLAAGAGDLYDDPIEDFYDEEAASARQEEDAMLLQMLEDPILLKNTNLNASFIPVPKQGLQRQMPRKQSKKKIAFMESIEEIPREAVTDVADDDGDFDDGLDVIAKAVADLSSLDDDLSTLPNTSTAKGSPFKRRPHQSRASSLAPQPRVKSLYGNGNPTSNAGGTKEQVIYTPPMPPKQSAKSFDENILAPKMKIPNAPQQQQIAPYQQQQQQQTQSQASRLMGNVAAPVILSPPPKRKITVTKTTGVQCSPPQAPHRENTSQTEPDAQHLELQESNRKLMAYIESLEQQLHAQQEENKAQLQSHQEQKNAFEKLSANAYKKIEDLVTEKSIMSIEISSLKEQIDMVLEIEDEIADR